MARYEKFSIISSGGQPLVTDLADDETAGAMSSLPAAIQNSARIVCDGYRPTYAPEFRTEYSSVRTILPTSLGPVELHFTDGGHVMADSNASSGYDGGDLMYDGYRWYASIHLYAASGWDEDPRDPEVSSNRHQFTVASSLGRGNCTPKRRAAIVAAVREAVIAFITEHPEIPATAEVNHLTRKLETAQKDEDDTRSAYQLAHLRAVNLAGELRRAKASLNDQAGTYGA